MNSLQLILGSSSVARKNILNEMGFEFQVMVGFSDFFLFPPGFFVVELFLDWIWFLGFRPRTSTRGAYEGRIPKS
jgi:hypothetical protein